MTASIVFFGYFLIKFPIVLQKTYLNGDFIHLSVAYIAGGLVGGILITLLLFLFTAVIIHLILNKWKKAGLCFEDAFTLLILSLTPQLLLIFELPFILLDYQQDGTSLSTLILRLVTDLFSLRVFYSGLLVMFKVTAIRAISVVTLPALILITLLLKLLFL